MGVGTKCGSPKPFTHRHVQNKNLVIKMLQYEENLAKSEEGQQRYRDTPKAAESLICEKGFQRDTLHQFRFDTTDKSLEMYRTIFRNYYTSPTDYDKDVMEACYYFRNNRLKFYTTKKPQIGDVIPNATIMTLEGNKTELFVEIPKTQRSLVCAFSGS